MTVKIAVAGAGIYGATAAIRLAEQGHTVHLFDPLGILRAASAINQYRVHSGYHYPRSSETISEILEARAEFIDTFAPAIARNSRHYYAIPREGSLTRPDAYEKVMAEHGLSLRPSRPEWMNFDFIGKCY
jgi:glycine/D-amino acid oxidase-like deaminating enzyme